MNETHLSSKLIAPIDSILKELSPINRLSLAAPNRLAVACSGGVDSMLLADVLIEHIRSTSIEAKVIILTVDHQLHPQSEENAEAVCRYWRGRGIESHLLIADPLLISSGSGVEDGARKARYAAIEESVISHQLECVFFAHHAGDQVETLLMRLQGPSGLRGMGGIPQQRGWVWRPWLKVEPKLICEIHNTRSLPVYEDPTNVELRYLRNKVRHYVLPSCEETFESGWQKRVAVSAQALAEEADVLHYFVQRFATTLITDDAHIGRLTLHWTFDPKEHPKALQRSILRYFYTRALYYFSDHSDLRRVRDQMNLLEEIWAAPHHVERSLPHGLIIWGKSGHLVISASSRLPVLPENISISLESIIQGEEIQWGEWTLSFAPIMLGHSEEKTGDPSPSDRPYPELGIDIHSLRAPLLLSRPVKGARFRPVHSPGSKRVKRLWSDQKVPLFERDRLPVLLEANDQIVWAPYCRPSHHSIPASSQRSTTKEPRHPLYWIKWTLRDKA